MPDYTLSQIKNMQDEATRRVREMNRRSKYAVKQTNNMFDGAQHTSPPKNAPAPQQERNDDNKKNEPPKNNHAAPLNFLQSLDLKRLLSGENSEQTMLLLLVLILISDSTSEDFLIYALIYIML